MSSVSYEIFSLNYDDVTMTENPRANTTAPYVLQFIFTWSIITDLDVLPRRRPFQHLD